MAQPLTYQQDLIDAIPVPLFFLDMERTFVGSNAAFKRLIGKTDDEVRQRGVYTLLSKERAGEHEAIDQILLENGTIEPFEDDIVGLGARLYSVIFQKSLVRDSDGSLTGIVTTLVDLSELKHVEKALVASESQKKAILDGFPGIIILFDTNLSAIWVNDSVWRQNDTPIGKLCHEIICNTSVNCMQCAVMKSLREGRVQIGIQRIELPEDGQDKYYEVIGTPVKDAEDRIESVIVIARDITDRFKLEKQLRHAQKMEAIGTLAGGIAHDFNNVLTPILGYSEIIKLKMLQKGGGDDTISSYLGEILKAGKRAKSLVEQILAFSRSSEQKESLQHVHPIVKEVIKLLRVTLPSTIQIEQDIDEKCGPASIDPVQIHQVLINLCTNSADAIGNEHGTLTISLRKKASSADNGNGWIELSVEDSGCGMSSELRERIFDPYFTTKEKGRGTGMGLSLVHSIITRHGGRIEVESEEKVGTIVRVVIPKALKQTTLDKIVNSDELVGGEGHVMLVDDDPQVVRVTSDLLKNLGYRVTSRSSPTDALNDFTNNPDSYDLLLTDLTMPKLTGLELSVEIKKLRADLPIILFTGYSERLSREDATEAGINDFFMKPVSLQALSRAVGRLIRKS